jgi:REP element-mobilizing transposase RayT
MWRGHSCPRNLTTSKKVFARKEFGAVEGASSTAGIPRGQERRATSQSPPARNFSHSGPSLNKNIGPAWKITFLGITLTDGAAFMPNATFRRYAYRRRLPHYQRDDRPVFVTFCTPAHQVLSCEARMLALQHCLHDDGKTIHLHAAVVMPDHMHLLFTALRDVDGWTFALPEILRAIKGSSARSINKLAGRTGRVWQDESFDHVMRGDESLQETIDYIRQNSVRIRSGKKPGRLPVAVG